MRTGLLLFAFFALACSGKQNTFDLDASDDDGGVVPGDETFVQPGDGGVDDGGGKKQLCSPDLRSILDENGNLVMTCPDDQGCAGGTCVPACDAARASQGSVGCDFMVATPSFFADLYPGYYAPCFAMFVANNWPKPAKVTVQYNGQSFNVQNFGRIPQAGVQPASWQPVPANGIPPGQVGVLFLSANPQANYKCPAGPAVPMGTAVQNTGRGRAFKITTDYPVTGYDIVPFGGASSALPGATLLLPTSAWGTNYIGVVPKLSSGVQTNKGGPHWGQVVALEDGTTVDIVPTVALPSGTNVAAAPAKMKSTYTLSAGEFIQWQAPFSFSGNPSSIAMDMSGSIVSANKKVAFNGGNGYLCLGSATASDPPVPGAPSAIKLAQMLEFEAKGAFTVKSQDAQHPFYLGTMMSGCNTMPGNNLSGQGDEDYTNVIPSAQFLQKYVFFTDVTYTTTSFSIVRRKTSAGFKDVTVDCVGKVSGWKPVGASGQYEYAVTTILETNVPKFNNCQNGPHSAQSDGPFGLTVWGLAPYASYSYPAGGNVASINTVVVPPIPPN